MKFGMVIQPHASLIPIENSNGWLCNDPFTVPAPLWAVSMDPNATIDQPEMAEAKLLQEESLFQHLPPKVSPGHELGQQVAEGPL